MTIALSYLDDLSRVRIALSGYADGTVRVERSTNGLLWDVVRGGLELPVSGGVAELDDYEFPISDLSDPLNPNPGFESGTDEWNTGGCTLTRSTDESHSGRASGLITPDGSATAAILHVVATSAPVSAGGDYTFSAWAYSPDGWDEVVLQVQWVNGSGSGVGSITGPTTAVPAGVWTMLSLTAEAPVDAAQAQQILGMTGSPTASDLLYVDDVALAEAQGPVTYRVTPVDPGGGGLVINDASLGNRASTPDTATLDITGDLDLRVDVELDEWEAPGDFVWLLAKWDTSSQRSYALRLNAAGELQLAWSEDGTEIHSATATKKPPIPETGRVALRATIDVATDGLTTHVVRFYTASTIAGPWVQLGTERSTLGSTSIHAGTADLMAGQMTNFAGAFTGVVFAAEVRDGIDGAVVADPRFDEQPTGTTSFADDAGLTWSVDGSASIVAIEDGSITPTLGDCEIWLKSVRYPLLNQEVDIATYSPLEQAGRANVSPIQGRSYPVAVTDVAGAFQLEMTFRTETADAGRRLHLSLAVGDIFYLQIPPDGNPRLPPRSMYVVVTNTQVSRLGVGEMRHISVSLTEVVKPAPRVVGTLLTWRTVRRLYGDWNQLRNAEPSWNDLLATVGSVDDLVVI